MSDLPSGTVLAFDRVGFAYNGRPVLRNLSLHIRQGEFTGILGPNGAGKTTLLKLANRILEPDSGTLTFFGRPLDSLSRREVARKAAMVAQENPPPFSMTVAEVVMTGRTPFLPMLGFETRKDLEQVYACLHRVEMRSMAARPFNTLSGGEKQRVLLAAALAQTPRLLLLDEPTSALDLHHQMILYRTLSETRDQGAAILAVTHDINLASRFCDRLLFLKGGRIIEDGAPRDVLTPEKVESLYDVPVTRLTHPGCGTPLVFPS